MRAVDFLEAGRDPTAHGETRHRATSPSSGGVLRPALVDRPAPVPGPREVRVRVHGAALNRADVLMRHRRYPNPPARPGLEYAGLVDQTGSAVEEFQPGDRVWGLANGLALADYVVVPADHTAPAPEGIDLVTAAAIPEAFLTAYDALFTLARTQPGERVLIHAVGSGVGTAALQLANLAGATTIGTSRSAAKLSAARRLGLDHAQLVPASPCDILDATGPADVVLDLVGADLAASVAATASHGRIVLLGALAAREQHLDLVDVLSRRLTLHGSMLRTRSHTEKTALTRLLARRIGPLLRASRLQPVVDTTYPADQAEAAFDHLDSDTTFGKLVLDFTAHPSSAC